MPDGGEILNKNICKKTSGLLFAAIFLLSGGVLAGCGGGESESEEIISCYLDFINPETGEYLAESPLTYKDCYLTYDGTEKTLNYVVRVIDNDEIITPKIEVTLHYNKDERRVCIMAQTTLSVRMDDSLKSDFDKVCNELGLSMTTAITMLAKKMTREKRLPFEVSVDPFYSEENLARLRRSIAQMESTGGTVHEVNLDD